MKNLDKLQIEVYLQYKILEVALSLQDLNYSRDDAIKELYKLYLELENSKSVVSTNDFES